MEFKDLDDLEKTIDAKKVGDIVIDALQEILPHVRGASTAEIMMNERDFPLLRKS